jgi:osmoprotectant transport system permease protein
MNDANFQATLLHKVPAALEVHLYMVLIAVSISIIIAVPIGILLTRPKFRNLGVVVMNILNVLQTIPGMAIIAIIMPVLGMGLKPTIVALVFQALLPIARNTIAGLNEVSSDVKEAALGMGMSRSRVLKEVEIPLAMPVILAGIRTATVYVVSVGTLAAYIGGGGLGDLITTGLNMMWSEYLLVGAGLGAVLAIGLDRVIGYVEYKMTPPGLQY